MVESKYTIGKEIYAKVDGKSIGRDEPYFKNEKYIITHDFSDDSNSSYGPTIGLRGFSNIVSICDFTFDIPNNELEIQIW